MTIIYNNINYGDHVKCNQCDKIMLLPCGADVCPECGAVGCLAWVDENNPERDITEVGQAEVSDTELNVHNLY